MVLQLARFEEEACRSRRYQNSSAGAWGQSPHVNLGKLWRILPIDVLHIFERALKLPAENPFDQRLEQAIQETSQEREFEAIYQESLEAQFTKEVLLDVARTTGHILRYNPAIETIQEEATFGGKDQTFIQLDNGHSVHMRSKVNHIDRLKADGALGVVDYKSSLTQFQFPNFFNFMTMMIGVPTGVKFFN